MIALSDLAHFIQLFSKSLVYKITSKENSVHFHVICVCVRIRSSWTSIVATAVVAVIVVVVVVNKLYVCVKVFV